MKKNTIETLILGHIELMLHEMNTFKIYDEHNDMIGDEVVQNIDKKKYFTS